MKYSVSRSIKINKSAKGVYQVVKDFEQWKAWSPWLIMEKDADVVIKKNDQGLESYSWEGKLVGAGEMVMLGGVENQSINYDLSFLKPFKSKAKFSFLFTDHGTSCDVTWTMDSSLPFFLFFMKKKMEAWIGMDYDRGLRMLKDHCESGVIHSKLKDYGEVVSEGFHYLGIPRKCKVSDMEVDMTESFEALMNKTQELEGVDTSKLFSIYHNLDFVKGTCEYSACVKASESTKEIQDTVKSKLSAGKSLKVGHEGPYRHIGNAWSLAYTKVRTEKLKPQKKHSPLEFYLNNPHEVSEDKISSMIYIPIK